MDGTTNLLLAEGLFIESALLIVLGLTTYKIRRDFYAIKEKYKSLKNSIREASIPLSQNSNNQHESGNFLESLTRARDQSLARHQQLSNNSSLNINPSATLTEQIAALRGLYLSAECDAYSKALDSNAQWKQLEQALKSIVLGTKTTLKTVGESPEKDQKIALLRERLNSLKNCEKQLRQKGCQLELAEQKISRMEERDKNMREGLNRIRQINRSLNLVKDQEHHNQWMRIESLDEEESINFALENISNAEGSLEHLNIANAKKFEIAGLIIEDLCDDESSVSETLKHKLKQLQAHLEKSEAEIGSLTKEIHQLKNGIHDKTQSSVHPTESLIIGEEIFCDDEDHFSAVPIERKNNTLNQIHLLQDNNIEQRNMIADLRREIMTLEEELQDNDGLSKEEVHGKTKKIEKLESLIRECDHCILALESEVEMLYNQLANIEDQQRLTNPSERSDQKQEVERLNKELDQMTDMMNNTMTLYGDQSILTKFAMESANASCVKGILIALDNAIRNTSLTPAIEIRIKTGRFNLIPESHFSISDVKELKLEAPSTAGAQRQIGEKLLFWNKRLTIIVTDLPDDNERKTQIKDNLSLLMNIAVSEIHRVETNEVNSRQKKTLEKLLTATQTELSNIDIQQNYQNDEFHLILNSLLKEIYTLSKSSDISKTMRKMLSNIVHETNERSALLFASGSLVTEGFSQLIKSLNAKLNSQEQ